MEAVLNTPVTTVIFNPGASPLTDAKVYLNGALSAQTVTATIVGTGPAWSVSFTPNSTGIWTLFGFGAAQQRFKVVSKSLYDYLRNIEDESIGSWSWNKETGVLTMLRQDSTTLATFNVADGLELSSRERVS